MNLEGGADFWAGWVGGPIWSIFDTGTPCTTCVWIHGGRWVAGGGFGSPGVDRGKIRVVWAGYGGSLNAFSISWRGRALYLSGQLLSLWLRMALLKLRIYLAYRLFASFLDVRLCVGVCVKIMFCGRGWDDGFLSGPCVDMVICVQVVVKFSRWWNATSFERMLFGWDGVQERLLRNISSLYKIYI